MLWVIFTLCFTGFAILIWNVVKTRSEVESLRAQLSGVDALLRARQSHASRAEVSRKGPVIDAKARRTHTTQNIEVRGARMSKGLNLVNSNQKEENIGSDNDGGLQ